MFDAFIWERAPGSREWKGGLRCADISEGFDASVGTSNVCSPPSFHK